MSVLEAYRRADRQFMDVAAPWIYVLLPGVALHELAHAAVGQFWADVEIDWTVPKVILDWDGDVPVLALFATFLAPLWLGGVAALWLAVTLPTTPAPVAVWFVFNWILLAGPSVVDVYSLLSGLRA